MTNKTEETKTEVKETLNIKQRQAVKEYLESRLYTYGIKSYEFEYQETPNYVYKALLTIYNN